MCLLIVRHNFRLKGQNQLKETEKRDWEEDDMDDVVEVMANEQEEELVLPMQPTTLEVESNGKAGWTEKRTG